MFETLVAVAIALAIQAENRAEAIVQSAKTAITRATTVRESTVRRVQRHVACGAVELVKAEKDAEFARKILVQPESIDQELVARQLLASAESQKHAVLALCAPSTVSRPRTTIVRKASPFQDDPFDEDRQDRRPADIDLDKTMVRVDGLVMPAHQLVDTLRTMTGEIEELRKQLREMKQAQK